MAFVRVYFVFSFCWTLVFGWSWRPLGVTSLKTSPYVTPRYDDFADMSQAIIMRIVDKIPDITIRSNGSAKVVYWVTEPMTGTKYEVCLNHCPRGNHDDLSTIWKNNYMEAYMVRTKGFQMFDTHTYNVSVNTEILHIRVQAFDERGDSHTIVTWTEQADWSEIASLQYIGIETIYGVTAFKTNGAVDILAAVPSSAENVTEPLNVNETTMASSTAT